MNENEISYDFFDEPAYGKYYLLNYDIPYMNEIPIKSGDIAVISISYTTYDPGNLDNYKDVAVSIIGGVGKEFMTASFVDTKNDGIGTIKFGIANMKEFWKNKKSI